jgi:4-amino-4-deoxy-L-arabinose transferase-like glycosyltransferase
MHIDRPTLTVFLTATAALAIGFSQTPLWDEDEARFAAIARTMVETGDWVVPVFNDTLAVDKPVLMHWCMAAAMTVFGVNEFAARLPSVIAALVTALALLRAGRRWCDDTTGVIAALAYVGCLLVAVEAHAATPDAILVALTAWATLLLAEPLVAGLGSTPAARPTVSLRRAVAAGVLLGLAVVCKGPIGFVGPLAVIGPWCWWLACERRLAAAPGSSGLPRLARAAAGAILDALRSLRPVTVTLAALAAAAPWYVAVSIQTEGAWTAGFFFVHNVGRFMAPMEKHSGGILFHPLTMLVGFYPWSCFLPLAVVIAAWRVCTRTVATTSRGVLLLWLVWFAVWVGGFSAAATKLPNYVLPAYPAAAFLVAMIGVDAARRAAATPRPSWRHPLWMASGLFWLAFGGLATAVTILVATRYGLAGAAPAAVVGVVPIIGAVACWRLATRRPEAAVFAFAATGLVYTALAVGPAGARIATANALPDLVRSVQARDGGNARLGTYLLASPNVVFYSNGHVTQFTAQSPAEVANFLRSGADAVLLVPEDQLPEIEPALPAGFQIVARARPAFRRHDVVAIGLTGSSPDAAPAASSRTASTAGATR